MAINWHARSIKLIRVSVALLVLAVLVCPRVAFAEAARVNGQSFDTLQAAVDSISDTGTIVITDNLTLSENQTQPDTATYAATVIPAGKHITITDDGIARTLNVAQNHAGFYIAAGASLTLDASADDKLVISGSSLDSNSSFSGSVITNYGTFNLKHATINGGNILGNQVGAIYQIGQKPEFNMSGGVIQNTHILTGAWVSSPVLIAGGTFNLSGGSISNNEHRGHYLMTTGGGVTFVTLRNNVHGFCYGNFNMSGGSISNNVTDGLGGGVFVGAYTNFHMTGGSIVNNTADYMGGGIALTALTDSTPTGYSATMFEPQEGSFVMDGGTISGNTARNGGGIYDNLDNAFINAGVLENNTAKFDQSELAFNDLIPRMAEDLGADVGWGHGGAIYVSAHPRDLYLQNAIVTDNTAKPQGHSAMGGGIWCCPTGLVDFRVTNGIAVYNNKAITDDTAGAGAAGDDVVKVSLNNNLSTITLPNRMLGGGPVSWYNDGAIQPGSVGSADPSAARYDAANPGTPVDMNKSQENVAVKAVTSPEAIELAEQNAKVFIRNNTASHGGGIATNGNLILTNTNEPEWSFKVTKTWTASTADTDKQPVELFLVLNDKVLDSQFASADNNWTVSFEGLPNPSSLVNAEFKILEGTRSVDAQGKSSVVASKEYRVSYADITTDAAAHTLSTTVTNEPIKPPETPPDNTPPTTATTPTTPNAQTPSSHASQTKPTPATGDAATGVVGVIAAALAFIGLAGVWRVRAKHAA